MKPIICLLALPLLLGAAPYWYQSQDIPYLYTNANATRIRFYGATTGDFADATVEYHGNMTPQRMLKQLQPYIKGKK